VRRRTLTIGAAATVASGALMGWFAVDALGDSSSAAVTSSTSTSARSDQTASTPVFGTPSDTFDTTSGGS